MDRSLALLAAAALAAASCTTTGTAGPPLVPLKPLCTVQVSAWMPALPNWNGTVFVADRDGGVPGPAVSGADFSPFHAPGGPLGNPAALTGSPFVDVYGIGEGWFRSLTVNEVDRGQLTPDVIEESGTKTSNGGTQFFSVEPQTGSFNGVSDSSFQAAKGVFEPTIDTVEAAPRFLFVGQAEPHMFACAGGVAQNHSDPTTWLFEITGAGTTTRQLMFVQDVLNGDDKFTPCDPKTAPLCDPKAGKPQPSISGPGDDKSVNGIVACAMTQDGDALATRALHLVSLKDGKIWHSMETNFPTANDRFRDHTPWVEVLPVALANTGVDLGQVESVAITARYQALHVFFVTSKNGRHFLFHTVRFPNGTWRLPVDVFADSGDATSGVTNAIRVGAGTCPAPGMDPNADPQAEMLVGLIGLGGPGQTIYTVRILDSSVDWGVPGRPPSPYAPWRSIGDGALDTSKFSVRGVRVVARPFSDLATPPPTP